MNRDRSGFHGAVRGFVDEPALDPVASEFMRHDQTRRTRSDDQHLSSFRHVDASTLPTDNCGGGNRVPIYRPGQSKFEWSGANEMRVFVAGATGALGSRLLPLLISAGHSVVGLTRTAGKVDSIRRVGAEAAVADALNRAATVEAIARAQPEVIVHEMTSLGAASDLRRFDRSFAATNRLRTDGLQNLLAGARQAGTRRVVAQSFCGWPYARTGGPVKSEDDPLDPDPPGELRRTLDAIRYLENTVTTSSEIDGIVLRYGAFYGPDTGLLAAPMIDQLRRRRAPLIGDASAWWSLLHIDDAAAATAFAIERAAPGIYNIADDDPAPVREWLGALASVLGAKPPRRIPRWLARIAAGAHIVAIMTEARAGSNEKAKRELAWQPARPSWRQGFAEALAQRQ
jgi:nucleoside-diphosphate-sugar epimerase